MVECVVDSEVVCTADVADFEEDCESEHEADISLKRK